MAMGEGINLFSPNLRFFGLNIRGMTVLQVGVKYDLPH